MRKIVTSVLCLIGFFFPVCASAQTAEEIAQAIEKLKDKTAKDFGISEEDAKKYLTTAIETVRATNVAKASGNIVDKVYAETMTLFSQAQLQGYMVVAEGQKLHEKMKGGVPGTRIPADLTAEIHKWVAFAGNTLVLSARSDAKAAELVTTSFLEAPVCKKGPQLNFPACIKIAEWGVGVAKSVGDHMKALVPATNVLMLGTDRLFY